MPTAIINFVQARAELLKLNLNSGMEPTSEAYKRMSQETTAQILKQVASIGKLNVENGADILSIIQGHVANEKPLFNGEQIATIRDSVNAKVDQSMGASNNSNTQYQKINHPEVWLTKELQDTMLANPPELDTRTKIQFRINALAAFFGRGGMLRPNEPTCRDVVSLALLDQNDGLVASEGLAWLRVFKTLAKQIAHTACESIGGAGPVHACTRQHEAGKPAVLQQHLRGEGARPRRVGQAPQVAHRAGSHGVPLHAQLRQRHIPASNTCQSEAEGTCSAPSAR